MKAAGRRDARPARRYRSLSQICCPDSERQRSSRAGPAPAGLRAARATPTRAAAHLLGPSNAQVRDAGDRRPQRRERDRLEETCVGRFSAPNEPERREAVTASTVETVEGGTWPRRRSRASRGIRGSASARGTSPENLKVRDPNHASGPNDCGGRLEAQVGVSGRDSAESGQGRPQARAARRTAGRSASARGARGRWSGARGSA